MKNKKKKSVFLAGLMVFMMMVSLLSGINLGAVKAVEIKPKPDDKFGTAGKTFTLIKEWDAEPEEGTKAEFIMRTKYLDENDQMTEVTHSAIVLPLDKDFYGTEVSKDKTTWTTKIPFEETFQGKLVTVTIEEKESKVYTSNHTEAQKISDKAEIKFTNTRVKRGLTIEKQWKDGEEKAAVTFDIKVNGEDAPKVLVNGDDKWEKTLYLPVYDKDGNAIEYTVTEENKDISKTEKLVDKDEAVDKRVIFGETEPANGGGSVVPAVPSTPTVPEAIPVIPVSDATPTVTTPETTPTVTVPDDTTPQGDANVSNGNTKAETTDEDTDNNEDVDDNDNNDKDVVDVDEDDIPQGEAKVKKDTSKEAPVKVEEDVTPKGSANLPKTGGTVGGFLSIIGMGLIGLALAIRKRK